MVHSTIRRAPNKIGNGWAFSLHAVFTSPAFTQPGDVKHQVSDKIGRLWTNMAKCGSPTCPGGEAIPVGKGKKRTFLNINYDGSFEVLSMVDEVRHLKSIQLPQKRDMTSNPSVTDLDVGGKLII
jgi:hypothetical protein